MGREIRRVPADWEHPKDQRGHYKPMHDRDFDAKAREWMAEAIAWSTGEHESQKEYESARECTYYWQWAGNPPDEEYYRPKWTDAERTHFQVYETVSEGTPVSPVFATRDALIDWLVNDGRRDGRRSRPAAEAFAKGGWAPSLVMRTGPDGFVQEGVEGLLRLAEEGK